ncbi:MAG: trehalose-phosphatase [Streptosporangiaceae bacterium]|nr:trehalose-phosphatase [Streptosporangiaceae bacterium]
MTVPQAATPEGRAGLDALLAAPRDGLIATDFDGTLAPIVPDPGAARAYPGAVGVLARLAPAVGTVAVITGRPAAEVVALGGLDAIPGIVVLGQYGWQRWHDGTVSAPDPPPGVAAARAALPGLLDQASAPEGTWIEDKVHALAVHTRRAADPQGALQRLRGPLTGLAARLDLAAEPGRMVIELRPPGVDKGAALTALARERVARSVIFCGDDLGDLPAFAAVRSLRAAGIPGCTVGSGSDESPQVAAEADLAVAGPAGVTELLAAIAAALGVLGAERGQLVAEPARGRAGRGDDGERGAAAAAFGIRHGKRPVQRRGGLADVVRVDQQRGGAQRRGGSGLPGQQQRAAAFGKHRSLLRDQVHAVPDRIDNQHVGERAGGQRPRVVVAHLQQQRVPLRGAELLGDLLRDPPHLLGVGPVFGYGGPRRVGERHVQHPAPPLRPGREQLTVGGQAADDVLGQLGAVHPDDQLLPRRRPAQRAQVRLHVSLQGAGPQRGSIDAERMHAHAGDPPPVADPGQRARCALACAPGHLRAQQRLAAVEERVCPPVAVEAEVVRAKQAIEQRAAHLGWQYPVIVGGRPGSVPEVGDAGVSGLAGQPVPQQPGSQRQVIVLHQDADGGGRHELAFLVVPGGLAGQGLGERLVVGLVRRPVAPEFPAELRLVRGIEQHVVGEPQDGVGHAVVRALEGGPRDVEHTHRDAVQLLCPGVQACRGRAVRIGQRRADPPHLCLGRHRRQPRRHPRDQAPAAAPAGQRAAGAELVGDRTPVGRHEYPSLHSPAG